MRKQKWDSSRSLNLIVDGISISISIAGSSLKSEFSTSASRQNVGCDDQRTYSQSSRNRVTTGKE